MNYAQSLRAKRTLSHVRKYLAHDPSAFDVVIKAQMKQLREHKSFFQRFNWNRQHSCKDCQKYRAAGNARGSVHA